TAMPGASNVIPGVVELTLDVRHQNDALRKSANDTLRTAGTLLARRRGVACEFDTVQESNAVPCDTRLQDVLKEAIRARGLAVCELPSGAGHDAVALAALCPVAMLFVRCRGGVSHHPDEFASDEDIAVAL